MAHFSIFATRSNIAQTYSLMLLKSGIMPSIRFRAAMRDCPNKSLSSFSVVAYTLVASNTQLLSRDSLARPRQRCIRHSGFAGSWIHWHVQTGHEIALMHGEPVEPWQLHLGNSNGDWARRTTCLISVWHLLSIRAAFSHLSSTSNRSASCLSTLYSRCFLSSCGQSPPSFLNPMPTHGHYSHETKVQWPF